MKKGKGLTRSSLREKKAKSTEEIRKEMIDSRSRFIRCNFMLTHADKDFLDDLVKRIRREAGIEVTKSGLVRKAINKFRDMEINNILGTH